MSICENAALYVAKMELEAPSVFVSPEFNGAAFIIPL